MNIYQPEQQNLGYTISFDMLHLNGYMSYNLKVEY